MVGSVRVGIALTLLSVLACADAPTAPSPTSSTASDPELADARIAARPLVAVGIGDLGGGSALARNISTFGTVVGSSMTAGGEVHAFAWSRGGGMRDLGTLARDSRSDAVAINVFGEIVGTSGTRAVRWSRNGRIKRLRAPGAERSAATDINAAGMVSGWAVYPPTRTSPRLQLPVVWDRTGAIISLGVPEPRHEGEAVAVNDRGVVAATIGADIIHLTRAALWDREDGWRVLEPQVVDGRAVDLNLGGDVVGMDLGKPWSPPPLLWRHDGTLVELSPLGGDVRGINLFGQMVGRAVLEESGPRLPVMWNRDLSVVRLAVPEDRSSVVNAISDLGEIVGGIGAEAVLWTRYPGTLGRVADKVLASRTAGARSAPTALPAWLAPEHQRCTRRTGPLQAGEATCAAGA
ncbi:MAG: hypothetical protein ACYC2G_15760 [Gemmatimonadaceae bacterium]